MTTSEHVLLQGRTLRVWFISLREWLARFPLSTMQPAILAFWRAYAKHTGQRGVASDLGLIRASRFAAARLIQSAVEHTQAASTVTGNIILMLQVAANMLADPEQATRQLFSYECGAS